MKWVRQHLAPALIFWYSGVGWIYLRCPTRGSTKTGLDDGVVKLSQVGGNVLRKCTQHPNLDTIRTTMGTLFCHTVPGSDTSLPSYYHSCYPLTDILAVEANFVCTNLGGGELPGNCFQHWSTIQYSTVMYCIVSILLIYEGMERFFRFSQGNQTVD